MILICIFLYILCVRVMPQFAYIAWRFGCLYAFAVSRVTAWIPFPCTECLCVAMCGIFPFSRTMRKYILLWILIGYFALWYPAYYIPTQTIPPLNAQELSSVCATLIEELREIPECPPVETLARDCHVKLARYPEWMRCFRLLGIYIPHTAEVILSPDADAYSAAFTMCHELQHALGIADEGEANLRAYAVCIEKGGIYAYSAKLWHLKYSMQKLYHADFDAWYNLCDAMSPDVYAIFQNSVHGFSRDIPQNNFLFRLLGISDAVCDYDILAYQK